MPLKDRVREPGARSAVEPIAPVEVPLPAPGPLSPAVVIALQRSSGNAAVARLLRSAGSASPVPVRRDAVANGGLRMPQMPRLGERMGVQGARAARPTLARLQTRVAPQMEAAAKDAETHQLVSQTRGPTSDVGTLDFQRDLDEAEGVRKKISGQQKDWDQALDLKKHGGNDDYDYDITATPAQKDENDAIVDSLENYISLGRSKKDSQELFKAQILSLERDYQRFIAQITAFGKTKQGSKTLVEDDAEKIAQRQLASTGIKQGAGEFENLATSNPTTATHLVRTEAWEILMHTQSQEVAKKSGELRSAHAEIRAAGHDIQKVMREREVDLAQQEVENRIAKGVSTVGETAMQMAGYLEKTVAFAGYFLEAAVREKKVTGDAVSSGAALPVAFLSIVFNAMNRKEQERFQQEVQALREAVSAIKNSAYRSALDAAVDRMAKAEIDLANRGNELVWAQMNLHMAKNGYRKAMGQMGMAADKAGGRANRFEVVAQIKADADTWLAQSRAAQSVGTQLQDDSKRSVAAFRSIGSGERAGGSAREIKYWELHLTRRGRTVRYWTDHEYASLYRFKSEAADQTVDRALKDLREAQTRVATHAAILGEAFARGE